MGEVDGISINSDEKVIIRNPVFLNNAAEDTRQKYSKAITGVASKQPTWKKCVGSAGFGKYSYTSGAGAAGSMYVRKYFKPEEKQEMLNMISYIRESFGRILDNLPWMDAETKTQAKK